MFFEKLLVVFDGRFGVNDERPNPYRGALEHAVIQNIRINKMNLLSIYLPYCFI